MRKTPALNQMKKKKMSKQNISGFEEVKKRKKREKKRKEIEKKILWIVATSYSWPVMVLACHARCLCLGLGLLGILRLADPLRALTENELNVGRVGHVCSDTAVSTVHTTAHLRGTLSSDVVDEETVQIKLLALSVGLGVLNEGKQDLAGLLRPATLSAVLLLFK